MMVSMVALSCDGLLELPLHMIDFLTLGTTITTSPSSMLSSVFLGCKLGGQPHSGRAGFATDLIVQGETIATVQARGRWLSESSFRCYVDGIGPRHQSKSGSSRSLGGS